MVHRAHRLPCPRQRMTVVRRAHRLPCPRQRMTVVNRAHRLACPRQRMTVVRRAHRLACPRQKPNRTEPSLRQIPIVFEISRSKLRHFISQEVPNYYILQHETLVVLQMRKVWTRPHVSPPAVRADSTSVES